MMLLKALEKYNYPFRLKRPLVMVLDMSVCIILVRVNGYLYAYTPAVNEKGKVTFGEVYLVLKGNQKDLL